MHSEMHVEFSSSQWDESVGKAPAAKPEDLRVPSLELRVEGGNRLYKVILWPLHSCCDMHPHKERKDKQTNKPKTKHLISRAEILLGAPGELGLYSQLALATWQMSFVGV